MNSLRFVPFLALAACSSTAGTDAAVPAADTVIAPTDAAVADVATTTPDSSVSPPADAAVHDAAPDVIDASPLIVARPYGSVVPPQYDPATPMPLFVLLHGYSATGQVQAFYLGLDRLARTRGFLLAYPDGTVDSHRNHFWNATDGCCNFDGSPVDDVAYVSAVIDDMSARYNVDPNRIFMMGHSNGGFMTYRFACEHANRIAAFVSLAGANWLDTMRCPDTTPVSFVEIHGTIDDEVLYNGSSDEQMAYPGARTSLTKWIDVDGCGPLVDTTETLDLDTQVAGNEAHVSRAPTCAHGAVELWTMQGSGHLPIPSTTFGNTIFNWMMAHPKP